MRNIIVVAVAVLFVGCTKKNPNLCCTDSADCQAIGLPDGTGCKDGLVCRGNQCIAETCSSAANCESLAPYCVSGLCTATCGDDNSCPGAGQDPSDRFCVGGVCVACRDAATDCPASTPVCDMGSCRTCVVDDECPSRVCDVDSGVCIDETTIRYADAIGVDANPCTLDAPCTITRALSIVDIQHPIVRMLPGMYGSTNIFPTSGSTTIVGTGASAGVISVGSTGQSLSVRGLTAGGVSCSQGGRLALRDVTAPGVTTTTACQLSLRQTVLASSANLSGNMTVTIDRSKLGGVSISCGTSCAFTMTNSIATGVSLSLPNSPGLTVTFAYNTFYYDGSFGQNTIVSCPNASTTPVTFINNVFYDPSNSDAIAGPYCTFSNNIAFPMTAPLGNTIIQDPKLVDPPTGDFHLQPMSPAIDAAISTNVDPSVDYDGTARPQGARRDIGAFEYKP